MNTTEQNSHSPATAAIIKIDSNWLIDASNQKAEEMIGMTAADLIGKPAKEVFCSKKEFADLFSLCEPVRQGKVISNHPIRICDSRGNNPRSVLATILPLPGSHDQPEGAIICLKDASELAYIQQVAMDCVADGVFTTDTSLNITSFNKAAETITGKSRQDVIGAPCTQTLQCNTCNENCSLQQSIDRKERTNEQSVFIKDKKGTSVPVNLNTAPLYDDHGNVIGGIGSFHDNTFSLRSSLILDSIADGVFTVDQHWKITSFNKAAESITGWSNDEAIGKSCSDVFHSSICGKNCAIAESLYNGRPVSNRSITIHRQDGEKIPISISASPLADHEGNIIGGVETFRDLSALTSLRNQLTRKYHFDEIVSKSKAMQRLFTIMPEIASSPSTVLIYGESGTGKELIARALYNISNRQQQPFIALNCGALPEHLLESELFGYKAGAFTDAKKDKEGRFAAAEGGTLFLDEIGDIPINIQVKLLRVLQEKVYEPLGSNKQVETNARIITATNKDLKTMVIDGTFREDLYYRLNVVRIQLPPLRERKEDIPLLVNQFIKEFCTQFGKDIVGISNSAINILMRHNFPGNIRELKNIIEYAFILCEGGYILPEHLPEPFDRGTGQEISVIHEMNRPQTLEEIEKQAIILALENNKWKKVSTCEELKISKDTLRRKMIKYNLHQPNLT